MKSGARLVPPYRCLSLAPWLVAVLLLSAACSRATLAQPGPIPTTTSAPADPVVLVVEATPPAQPTDEPSHSLFLAQVLNEPLPTASATQAVQPTATSVFTATAAPALTPTLLDGGGLAAAVSDKTPTPTPAAESPLADEPSAQTVAPAAARPQPTPDGESRTARLPILMYHYLSAPPAGANIYRQDLSVPPDLFAEHLDALSTAGYTTVSLYDLLEHLTQGAPLPEKPVIITFDDGYRDNYVNAFPLLRAHGMTATFFVITDFIDEERPDYLSWDMAREMLAGGMSIESHGRNHFSLEDRDADFLVWQALGSAETIEYELGRRPHFVSYPAGEYDRSTIDIFHSAHYWAGLTTTQGSTHSNDKLFELPRVRVRNTTTPENLIRLLELDW